MDQNEFEKWKAERQKYGEVSNILSESRVRQSEILVKVVNGLLDPINADEVVIPGCIAEIIGVDIATKYPDVNWHLTVGMDAVFDRINLAIEEFDQGNIYLSRTDFLSGYEFPVQIDAIIALLNSIHTMYDRNVAESFIGRFFDSLGNGGMLAMSTTDFDAIKQSPPNIKTSVFEAAGYQVRYQVRNTIHNDRRYDRNYTVKYRKIGTSIWKTNSHNLKFRAHSAEEISDMMEKIGFVDIEIFEHEDMKRQKIVRGYKPE